MAENVTLDGVFRSGSQMRVNEGERKVCDFLGGEPDLCTSKCKSPEAGQLVGTVGKGSVTGAP